MMLSRLLLAATTLVLAACGGTGDKPTPTQYADDAAITARVRLALVQSPIWRDANIQVSTQSGVVQLTGSTSEKQNADHLTTLVAGIEGVQGIENDVR